MGGLGPLPVREEEITAAPFSYFPLLLSRIRKSAIGAAKAAFAPVLRAHVAICPVLQLQERSEQLFFTSWVQIDVPESLKENSERLPFKGTARRAPNSAQIP